MAGGGVCAVLDYEVEHMAEFVAEMATSVVMPNVPASTEFRKFVSSMLSSTRLPKSTVLLGMNYLAKRINTLKANNAHRGSESQVYRTLTVALMLASKFLDDNTFQNRSWSDVSGFSVTELNALEKDWLIQCGFSLYVNLDYSHDYNAWIKSWDEWRELKEQAVARANRERLASLVPAIDTDISRYAGRHSYNSFMEQQAAEIERYQAIKRAETASQAYRMPVDWSSTANNMSWAPLTPPDSGYGTPEYINSAASANARYNEWFSAAAANGQWNARYQQPQQAHNHHYYGHRQNGYSHNYGFHQSAWDHNIAECSCSSCLGPVKHQAYFGQPVVG